MTSFDVPRSFLLSPPTSSSPSLISRGNFNGSEAGELNYNIMVRGNWQRRIERTEARRKAEKERKEQRRNRQRSNSLAGEYISDYKASYRRLEEWLDDKGDSIGVSYEDDDDNRNGGGDISCITVDIWTDARPHTRSEYYAPNSVNDDVNFFNDVDSDEDDGGGRKGRFKGKKKERGHRGGFKKTKGGKSHPNTKNKHENETTVGRDRSGSLSQQQQNNVEDERLCAQEFYFGKDKCKGTKKLQFKQQKGRRGRSDSLGGDDDNGGCSFQHYHQLPKAKRKQEGALTLNQVLSEKFEPHHIQYQNNDDVHTSKPMASLPVSAKDYALKSSFNALVDNDLNDSAPCIDMVYHSRFSVENKAAIAPDSDIGSVSSDKSVNEGDYEQDDGSSSDHDENETKQSRVNHALQNILEEEKILPTSIVYITIQGILVYDRNRRGLVFTEKEERFLLYGNAIELTAEEEEMYLRDNDEDQTGNQPIHIHEQLTHHLLDEILSYCEDAAVSVLPQICRSWRDEVGTRSPILWKMLLNRHRWPSDVNGDSDDVLEQCQQSKEAFISHYTVVRDVRALVNSCIYISGGGGSGNANVGSDAALQVFKATKGAPVLSKNRDSQCLVKVWPSAYSENERPRALAAYEDLSLRLFEVVRGGSEINSHGSSHTSINCRQVVCLRATPPSVSQKKDSVAVISIGLDENSVACFVEESVEREGWQDNYIHPWMTVISRDDIVCAGNEGMLEDDCIHSHDLRAVILDFILGDDSLHDELQEALHIYLSSNLGDGDTSGVCIVVTPNIIPCGKGNFLFHAFIEVPSTIDDDITDGCQGHRLFLFSSRFGVIVKSLHLERYREGTTLFASRPFKRRPDVSTSGSVMCTNILISGPTMPLLFMSVEIDRDGADIIKKSMIDGDELAPWSQMCASLTSTHALYSTDPLQGPVLHIKRIPSSFDEMSTTSAYQSIEVGERNCVVRDIFVIREHYVVLIIGTRSNHEEEEDEIDGQWFGINSSLELVVYHIHSRQEMYRSNVPSEALSIDCIGETLAMNVSNLGFVITGENARDVARIETDESNTISSPPGKNSKSKKNKRQAGSGKKKDGFARGMRIM